MTTYTLDFVLIKVWDEAHYEPWQGATKVYDFMHHEGHNPRSEHIIL